MAETSLKNFPRAAKSRSRALFLALGDDLDQKRRHQQKTVKIRLFGLKPLLEFLLGALGPLLSIYFWLKPLLEFFQEPSRALLDYFFSVQEASKSGPRALQEATGRLSRFLTPPGTLRERFWTHFGFIFGPNLDQFGDYF